jgi:hypothetical protein
MLAAYEFVDSKKAIIGKHTKMLWYGVTLSEYESVLQHGIRAPNLYAPLLGNPLAHCLRLFDVIDPALAQASIACGPE